MKKIFVLILILTKLIIYSSAQNLIKNPDFEDGNIPIYTLTPPVDNNSMPTHWSIGPSNTNCSGTREALLFDYRFTNVPTSNPTNRYGTGVNIYQTWARPGNYVDPRITNTNRYIGFYGNNFDLRNGSPTGSTPIYGGNIISELEAPLEAGCTYRIRLWAIPIQTFDYRLRLGMNQTNHTNNRIEVVFFKNGVLTTCPGWIAFRTQAIAPIPESSGRKPDEGFTTIDWELCEGFFTVPLAMNGLDNIQIRLMPTSFSETSPSSEWRPTGVFVDDLELKKMSNVTSFTPTSGYICTNTSSSSKANSPWSTKNIEINGEFTIDRDLTINNNAHIRFGPDAKITVQSPYQLTIDQSLLDGNCAMWEGIIVQSGAKIVFTSNTLFDAVTGIKITGTSSEFDIHSNTFDASLTHIELNDCKTQGTGNVIHGNYFYYMLPLKNQSLATKGLWGINVYNIQTTNEVTIGKTQVSGGSMNVFENGYSGIQSTKSNVNVKYSEFNGMISGIEARGIRYTKKNTTPAPYGYTLNVSDDVNFITNQTGISVYDNCNLQVFNCEFTSCKIGISCLRNHDRSLIIGSDDGSTRNTFSQCLTGILLSDNHTLEVEKTTNDDNSNRATAIRVSFNDFNNMTKGMGVVISEFNRSFYPTYKKLDIRSNSFINMGVGLKFSNITGFEHLIANNTYPLSGMPLSTIYTDYTDLIGERVVSNEFNFTNKQNPEYIGIKVENTRGVQYTLNDFSHIEPSNWQNKGIWLDNSTHSNVRNNSFISGVGILAAGNMYESNFVCNDFNYGITGIQLAWGYLRLNLTGIGQHHGKDQLSARNNVFENMISFGQDIELWNTDVLPHNRWVWAEGEPLPKAIQFSSSTNQRTNVAIEMGKNGRFTGIHHDEDIRGPVECDPELMGGSPNPTAWYKNNDTIYTFPRYVSTWNNKYYLEKKFIVYDTLIASEDSIIAEIINVEKNIDTGNLTNASYLLDLVIPRNSIETNYVYLLNLLIEMKDSTFEHLDSSQISNVNLIASLQTITGGIPVFIARAILFNDLGIDYSQIDDDFYPTVKGKLMDSLNCIPDTLQGTGIALVDVNLNRIENVDISYSNINGEFTFNPYLIKTLDSNSIVGFITWPSKNLTTLKPEFKSLYEWKDTAFKNILTTGIYQAVLIQGDSVPVILNDTVITPDVSTYEVTNYDDGNGSNFTITKTGGNNVWIKEFNGYMNSYDKAIGIKKHDNGNLFVVSNLIINNRKGFEVWCIDTLGNLIWKHTHYDTLIEFEALGFDTTVWGGVKIAISANNGLGGGDILQLIEINTCQTFLDYFNHYYGIEEEGGGEPVVAYSSKIDKQVRIKIIPNPNQGSFIIQLDNTDNNSIFELYNLQGLKLYEKIVSLGINNIQLPLSISKGIYIGKIINAKSKNQKTVRIIID